MLDSLLGNLQFPVVSAFYSLEFELVCFLPVIEIAYEVYLCGIRRPLSEHPSLG